MFRYFFKMFCRDWRQYFLLMAGVVAQTHIYKGLLKNVCYFHKETFAFCGHLIFVSYSTKKEKLPPTIN